MKMYKTKTWQHEVTGGCGDTILFGRNIFAYAWDDTGEFAVVKDGRTYRLPVYTVNIDGELHRFAADEFSNGQWRFYLFKY